MLDLTFLASKLRVVIMSKRKAFVWLSILLITTIPASAQPWKKIGKALGSVAKTATKIVTAPTETVINAGQAIIGSKPASDIFNPVKDLAASTAQTSDAVLSPQRYLYNKAQQFASEVGGSPGEFIFDIGTFTSRYYGELANAGIQSATGVLQGQNPLNMAAAPLAAAIHAARERYLGTAKPLPDDVKASLRGYFPDEVLNVAKYVVGNIEITLPNFIGRGQKFMGNHHAVVVGDIIVFNVSPPSFSDDAFWWAHEITHIQQYQRMGIESFAFQYVVNLGRSIEEEADNNAARITGDRSHIGQSNLSAMSYDMSGQTSPLPQNAIPEYYVAQCFFPSDPYPVNYMVTNYSRIIAVDPITGTWLHVGWATPPTDSGVAWSYTTPMFRYAVFPNGGIFVPAPIFDPWGRVVGQRWQQIGHVVRLQ